MKKIYILIVLFNLISCQQHKDELKITILNTSIRTSIKSIDTFSIIKYEIFNNTNNKYYFNSLIASNQEVFYKPCVIRNNRFLKIYESNNNKEVNYSVIGINPIEIESLICKKKWIDNLQSEAAKLGYKNLPAYSFLIEKSLNFYINPKEKKYFEYYIKLMDGKPNDNGQIYYANLKKSKSYYAKLSIASDSTNYKNDLPRDILKTIEANNIKVYHGIVESSNKVPIKIIE